MLYYRKATINDIELYFRWVNEVGVREQSFNSQIINFDEHKMWFESKIKDENCMMLIFSDLNGIEVGQVRIEKKNNTYSIIGISVAFEQRGKGYSTLMLEMSCDFFLKSNPNFTIYAFIKQTNLTSKFAFEKAGFKFIGLKEYQKHKSFHLKKELCR